MLRHIRGRRLTNSGHHKQESWACGQSRIWTRGEDRRQCTMHHMTRHRGIAVHRRTRSHVQASRTSLVETAQTVLINITFPLLYYCLGHLEFDEGTEVPRLTRSSVHSIIIPFSRQDALPIYQRISQSKARHETYPRNSSSKVPSPISQSTLIQFLSNSPSL